MTEETTQPAQPETPKNDKEINFRAFEARMSREIQALRKERDEMEKKYELAMQQRASQETDDDEDDEPYIDKKKFKKKMSSFEKELETKIDQRAEMKANQMAEKMAQDRFLQEHPDFYETLQKAEILPQKDPEYANTIVKMPDNFERQKLVYREIKRLLDQEESNKQVQSKINQNQHGMFYSPSGVGTAPANPLQSDFSKAGQEKAYQKMKELQNRWRGG